MSPEHASDSRYERWEFSHEGSHCVARRLQLTRSLRVEWFRYTHTYASSPPRYVNQFHVIRDVRSCQNIQAATLRAKIEAIRPRPEPDGLLSDENAVRDMLLDDVLAVLDAVLGGDS